MRLYAYMDAYFSADQKTREMLREYRTEMDRIGDSVMQLIRKYRNIDNDVALREGLLAIRRARKGPGRAYVARGVDFVPAVYAGSDLRLTWKPEPREGLQSCIQVLRIPTQLDLCSRCKPQGGCRFALSRNHSSARYRATPQYRLNKA